MSASEAISLIRLENEYDRELMTVDSTLYKEILHRLDAVRRKENFLALVYGALISLLAAFGLIFAASIIERLAGFGTTGRELLFLAVAIGTAGAFTALAGPALLRIVNLLRSETDNAIAAKVGKHFPNIRDRLLDAMQMYGNRDALKGAYSLDLIDASFSDLYTAIAGLNFTEAVGNARIKRMGKFVSYAGCVLVLLFLISPLGLTTSFFHILNFGTSYASPLPIEFIVEPGNVEIVRGQSVPVTIRTEGKPVNTISLRTRQSGQMDFDSQDLTRGNDGNFHTDLSNLRNSVEYFASAEDVSSKKFSINVLDRPLIRSLRLTLTSPKYTRIPAKALDENIGDVSAYPGSKAAIVVSASKPISSGEIVFKNGGRLPLACTNMQVQGGFTVKENTTYHLVLRDAKGLSTTDPVEYTISVIPDEYPTAEIVSPGKNTDLTEQMSLDLFVRIKDDFGFSKVRLAYRLASSRYEKPAETYSYLDLPLPSEGQNSADFAYHWDLSSLSLVPEDAVAYYVEVYDNDSFSGPKSGKSAEYLLRLPSLEEVFSDVDQTHQASVDNMQSVAKEADELKKDVESLHRDLQKNQDKADWRDQKRAEEMVQRYQALKNKLDESSKQLDQMMQKMQDNKLLSNETMEKYMEMQKLMDELKDPALQEALKKLQESM
ncbi:MAG TPA: DUF4175 family protein, partial [Bacteroidota bacterium]|nr:DUF4175 family protein [Bacteroidota bacterium]